MKYIVVEHCDVWRVETATKDEREWSVACECQSHEMAVWICALLNGEDL